MNIRGFLWLEEIIEKLAWKHNVSQEEVEDCSAVRPTSALWGRATGVGRMFTPPSARRGAAGSWPRSSYTRRMGGPWSSRRGTWMTLKGDSMSGDELSASEVEAYREIGEHWDTHSLADVWDQTREVKVTIGIQSSRVC